GEAAARRAGLAVLAHEIDVEVDRRLRGRRRQLRLPLHVEPLTAEGVDDGCQRRTELTPAGQRARTDPVLIARRLVELRRERLDLRPRRMQRHLQARRLEKLLVVVGHRALAVEGQRVLVALVRKREADLRDDVAEVVRLRRARSELAEVRLEVDYPLVLRPDRYLVGADGRNVELAAAGRDVGGDLLPQGV